jgi:CheY-like chemotaxis protein
MLMDTLVTIFAGTGENRESGPAPAPAVDRHANSLMGVRILLAEDNEINQQIAVELLAGAGASVEVANDGLEAVNKMLDQPVGAMFDVLLMDMQMPRMDGYDATRRLRAEPRCAHLPIIAITAHATTDERQKCFDAGMNGHVPNPIDPSTLFDTIRRFVQPRGNPPIETPAMPVEPPLPHLDSLNTADGLARMAGNKKLYWKLLSQFVATEADAAGRIGAALKDNDRALAERLAHTVKGVAGNLGAAAVQNAAANLERAIARSSPADDIESLRASLDKCITELIAELQPVLPSPDGEHPHVADVTQLNSVIEKLSRYLAESDGAAVGYLESAAPQLRRLFEEGKFESFAALVENYSFSEALDQLMAVSEKYKGR